MHVATARAQNIPQSRGEGLSGGRVNQIVRKPHHFPAVSAREFHQGKSCHHFHHWPHKRSPSFRSFSSLVSLPYVQIWGLWGFGYGFLGKKAIEPAKRVIQSVAQGDRREPWDRGSPPQRSTRRGRQKSACSCAACRAPPISAPGKPLLPLPVYPKNCRSSDRYCTASLMCLSLVASAPSRSASIRAARRTLSYARALKPIQRCICGMIIQIVMTATVRKTIKVIKTLTSTPDLLHWSM